MCWSSYSHLYTCQAVALYIRAGRLPFVMTPRSCQQAVLVGGGYIGMEVAAALSGHGIPTSIVLPGPHLLSRLFTPKIAEFYEKFYEGETIHHVFYNQAVVL